MIVSCQRCGLALDVGAAQPGTTVRCRCTAVVTIPALPASAQALCCPSCGASAGSDAVSCAYCKSGLLPLLCAHCFSRNFLGSRNCAHCGAVLPVQAEPAGATGLRCPGCARELSRKDVGGFGIECCGGCGGVFLDHDTEERLYASRPRKSATVQGRGSTVVPQTLEPVRYKRCPRCGQMMVRKQFARGAGLIVDLCARDGTWFDAGELRRALEFVERGGLEEAQRKELAHLEIETERLRAARKDAHDYNYEQLGGLAGLLRED